MALRVNGKIKQTWWVRPVSLGPGAQLHCATRQGLCLNGGSNFVRIGNVEIIGLIGPSPDVLRSPLFLYIAWQFISMQCSHFLSIAFVMTQLCTDGWYGYLYASFYEWSRARIRIWLGPKRNIASDLMVMNTIQLRALNSTDSDPIYNMHYSVTPLQVLSVMNTMTKLSIIIKVIWGDVGAKFSIMWEFWKVKCGVMSVCNSHCL